MVVNFEFLDKEPLENIITCMHYKVDKVIFFGYHEMIQSQKKVMESYLRKYCGVKEVVFQPLSHKNLQSVLKTIRAEIERELSGGNDIYFDITGGESLILVAFGILSKEYKTPIHQYDIINDKIIELDEDLSCNISNKVQEQKVELNLDRYIEMHGGVINYNLHKDIKGAGDSAFAADVAKIWAVAKENWDYWNPFSDFLRRNMVPDENLQVNTQLSTIISALAVSTTKLKEIQKLHDIVDALAQGGILTGVGHTDGRYCFKFKSQAVKDCLWEGGSILELHTYQKEKKQNDDCRVGVHIDWDGVVHSRYGTDVVNEIDVLTLKGNVATFISCKSGKMEGQQALHALYELDTVTRRFGGKYAKKVLVTAKDFGGVYLERAMEMGIETRI